MNMLAPDPGLWATRSTKPEQTRTPGYAGEPQYLTVTLYDEIAWLGLGRRKVELEFEGPRFTGITDIHYILGIPDTILTAPAICVGYTREEVTDYLTRVLGLPEGAFASDLIPEILKH